MRKTIIFSLAAILFIILAICWTPLCNRNGKHKPVDSGKKHHFVPSYDSIPKYDSLRAKPIKNQYIIYFDKPASRRNSDFMDSLLRMEDSILDSCMCGVFLMEGEHGVDFITRRHDAGEDPELSGEDGTYVSYNYPINFGPQVSKTGFEIDKKAVQAPMQDISDPNKNRVMVAIVDSGFDPQIEAQFISESPGVPDGPIYKLMDYTWVNPDESANESDDDGNCIVDDINGFDARNQSAIQIIDINHGTAVAGIVAGFPYLDYPGSVELKLMNVKFADQNSDHEAEASLFDAVCALQYAIDKEADVIVASWGLYLDPAPRILREKVILAIRNDITIVAAAGNDSVDIDQFPFYPASFVTSLRDKHLISVASIGNNSNRLSDFSNFGSGTVLFAAPGEGILVMVPANTSAAQSASHVQNSSVVEMSGTSLSAPFVARIVAIIKAENPGIAPEDLMGKLIALIGNNNNNQTQGSTVSDGVRNGSILYVRGDDVN